MEYVQLGKSGLKVSKIIFGAMSIGSSKWQSWVLDEKESLEMLKLAWESGINTWDTANIYSNGESERIIGKALKEFKIPRHKVVIMTKCFNVVSEDVGAPYPDPQTQATDLQYVNQIGLSRQAIFNAVDASLKRLDCDYIDVLQIHRADPKVPFEETMKALHDLVQSGKVRYIGASSMWAYQFVMYQQIAEKNGWTKFVSMQNQYSLLYREEEREMIKYCKETGVGLIPWYALNAGKLTRPIGKADTTRANHKGITNIVQMNKEEDDEAEIINRVEELSKKKGWSMAQVAYAWIASKVDAPLIGLSKPERLHEFVKGVGYRLTEEEQKYLEEPYLPKKISGHA